MTFGTPPIFSANWGAHRHHTWSHTLTHTHIAHTQKKTHTDMVGRYMHNTHTHRQIMNPNTYAHYITTRATLSRAPRAMCSLFPRKTADGDHMCASGASELAISGQKRDEVAILSGRQEGERSFALMGFVRRGKSGDIPRISYAQIVVPVSRTHNLFTAYRFSGCGDKKGCRVLCYDWVIGMFSIYVLFLFRDYPPKSTKPKKKTPLSIYQIRPLSK